MIGVLITQKVAKPGRQHDKTIHEEEREITDVDDGSDTLHVFVDASTHIFLHQCAHVGTSTQEDDRDNRGAYALIREEPLGG
jgi:hypothetical protein